MRNICKQRRRHHAIVANIAQVPVPGQARHQIWPIFELHEISNGRH